MIIVILTIYVPGTFFKVRPVSRRVNSWASAVQVRLAARTCPSFGTTQFDQGSIKKCAHLMKAWDVQFARQVRSMDFIREWHELNHDELWRGTIY
jgi:hypothetical protein